MNSWIILTISFSLKIEKNVGKLIGNHHLQAGDSIFEQFPKIVSWCTTWRYEDTQQYMDREKKYSVSAEKLCDVGKVLLQDLQGRLCLAAIEIMQIYARFLVLVSSCYWTLAKNAARSSSDAVWQIQLYFSDSFVIEAKPWLNFLPASKPPC